jgi:hypothetical protein
MFIIISMEVLKDTYNDARKKDPSIKYDDVNNGLKTSY